MIIAGTGHRPVYCPCLYDESHPWLKNVQKDLIHNLTQLNPHSVITGMAIGWDTWLAEAALALNIPVFAYVPFKGQEDRWPLETKLRYKKIISRCCNVKYINENYTKQSFFERDEAMVNDCDHVFALWNPTINSGGTWHTVRYAEQLKKPITNFWR